MQAKNMKTYTIIETVRYEVEAKSVKDAEKRFLNAQSSVRDSWSVEVSDREVFETEAERELTTGDSSLAL